MDFLAETGFNVVFPVVWNRGVNNVSQSINAANV
jgi:uncharacterized lipoprotein YddW (UPF0748 family)